MRLNQSQVRRLFHWMDNHIALSIVVLDIVVWVVAFRFCPGAPMQRFVTANLCVTGVNIIGIVTSMLRTP